MNVAVPCGYRSSWCRACHDWHPRILRPTTDCRWLLWLDLAGTKANVVQLRAEAKDYGDIDAILRDGRIDLPTALAAAQAINGATFNPQITLKALSHFADGNLPRLAKATNVTFDVATTSVPPISIASRALIARLSTASSSCVGSTSACHKSSSSCLVSMRKPPSASRVPISC
jgi:hypothetical protein